MISFVTNILAKINPEVAHKVALLGLKCNLVRNKLSEYSKALEVNTLGFTFNHPVGSAAGFDKNAECVQQLLNCGFSFVEAGGVTIKPQIGNAKPRIFRLKEDEAIINRLGFNNKGIKYFQNHFKRHHKGIVGVNIGRNKDTADPILDYAQLAEDVCSFADYITINISSPNTAHLRDLHQKNMLESLLIAINNKIQNHSVPILLKISPDITDQDKEGIASLALKYKVDGLILTNTTVGRSNSLKSMHKMEGGGLSGKPLFALSTQILRDMFMLTNGKIVLIACGGIFNGQDAYAKIRSGASLLQIYTALIYQGFKVIDEINLALIELLKKDGFSNIQEAIGIDVK